MGALHEGHLSLVRMSKRKADVTVVSIFVNPTQFGANEDFSKYPRTIERDASMLVQAEVDFLFLPPVDEVYQPGASTFVSVEGVTEGYEGAIRPGHFRGVATVVAALFNMVQPTLAIFGQKDAQQVAVIKQMVRDLHFPLEIIVGDTERTDEGLALSSRNAYLSDLEKRQALALIESLRTVRRNILDGSSVEQSLTRGEALFRELLPTASLEYLDVVDAETFRKMTSCVGSQRGTVVIAARVGSTRLIDNLPIDDGFGG